MECCCDFHIFANLLLQSLYPSQLHNYVHIAGDVTVLGSMQLIADSDLHGENPQFTLTCISTGGPATNVTWTRDSEEVLGGVTVLDNAVTAQYTHTLTVAGRLPGQYQCTVSNNKPSQDSASIRVKGQCKYNKQYVLQVLSALNCGAQCTVMVDLLKSTSAFFEGLSRYIVAGEHECFKLYVLKRLELWHVPPHYLVGYQNESIAAIRS